MNITAQHTQGPWKHEGQGDITGYENDTAHGCFGPVDVACVYLRTVPGKTEANARLIAAAPELLEALQGVVTHWTRQFERRGHAAPDWCKKARAAIAKATGDQQ